MSTPTGSGYSDLPIQSLGNVLSTGWGPDATSSSLSQVLQGAFGVSNVTPSSVASLQDAYTAQLSALANLVSSPTSPLTSSTDRDRVSALVNLLINVRDSYFGQDYPNPPSTNLSDYGNLYNGDLSKVLNLTSPPSVPSNLNSFLTEISNTYPVIPGVGYDQTKTLISANPSIGTLNDNVFMPDHYANSSVFHITLAGFNSPGVGLIDVALPVLPTGGINGSLGTMLNGIGAPLEALLSAAGDPTIGADVAKYAFQDFLASNPLKNYSGTGNVGIYFRDQFTQFINNYHLATYNHVAPLVAQNATASDVALNFQDVFNAFFTDPTGQDYSQQLQTFLSQIVNTTGDHASVLPSASLKEWLSDVQNKYQIALYGATGAKSTVAGTFYKVDIINRILTLLTSILGTLQSMTASQAGNLTVLARWQQAYTEQQGKISFNVSGISGTQDQSNAINQRSQFVSMIQTKRSLVQDSSKALQSAVNQSNDTTSQQANLLSALLQQLSTILSAIYR